MTTGKKYEVYDMCGNLVAYGWNYAPISYKNMKRELSCRGFPSSKYKILIESIK